MAFTHTVGGTTFTEASFDGNAYSDETTGFPKALEKMVEHVANAYRGTSVTSNTIGSGSKTWTVTNANSQIPAFAVGMPVRVSRTSAPTTTYMQGEITAFTAATGSTTVNVSSSLGTGTHTDWTITIGGHQTTASASPLGVANGGTGAGTHTANNVLVGAGTSAVTSVAPGSAGNVLTSSGSAWTSAAGLSAAAAAGIIEANANFKDCVIFGPALDPVDWSGRTAAPTSALMLATIEDNASNSEINIYDLTNTTVASLSPIATVTLSGAAPAYGIDAAMGYIVCAIQGGAYFIDPHDGVAWAERTRGWPKFTNASSSPAINNNAARRASAGYAQQPSYDPRTGGPMPSFAIAFGAGSNTISVLKDNGTIVSNNHTPEGSGSNIAVLDNGYAYFTNSAGKVYRSDAPIDTITSSPFSADVFGQDNSYPFLGGYPVHADIKNGLYAQGGGAGLSTALMPALHGLPSGNGITAATRITRAYNTGYRYGDHRGTWLASSSGDADNEGEKDRSVHLNNLTQSGTPTEAAVESGAELDGYSGWTTSNYMLAASNAEWDVVTTGALHASIWFKSSGNAAHEFYLSIANSGNTIAFYIRMDNTGKIRGMDDGATASSDVASAALYDDGLWHKADWVRRSSTDRELYVDGVSMGSTTTDTGSLTSSGNLPLGVGINSVNNTEPAATSTLALATLCATAPTADIVRKMYEAEKGMFVANSKCVLQSSSTDIVLETSIDPITGKVAVTQTDAMMIFDGLAIDSTPTVNAGASEHNKLFGGDRVEINSVNLYATIAAKNLRGDLEIVRGLKAGLPAGVDLSKAKALLRYDPTVIDMSMNIKSVTDTGTGTLDVVFAIPFKSNTGYISVITGTDGYVEADNHTSSDRFTLAIKSRDVTSSGAAANEGLILLAVFGELENE